MTIYEHSTRFSEAHFDAKANRYQAALLSAPHARTCELLPFLLLLDTYLARPSHDCTLCDMLCGSGVLTQALKGCFRQIHGVDVSSGMLRYYPVAPGIDRHKAPVEEQSVLVSDSLKADAITALAGLHHVYETADGVVDPDASDRLQASVVTAWAKALPPGGVMVVADVTDPDADQDAPIPAISVRVEGSRLSTRYQELSQGLYDETGLPRASIPESPDSIEAIHAAILDFAPSALQASPGTWFRETVAKRGLYGHVDHFLRPRNLVAALDQVPGVTCCFAQMPTPWIFQGMDEMVYFFYEKFALGPVVDATEDIPASLKTFITEKVSETLGMDTCPGGAVAVGWTLGFYVCKKDAHND